MNDYIKVFNGTVHKVPVLFCCKKGGGKKPPVILLHKLLQDKESELPIAWHLANNNYFVIIPDLPEHGERENSFKYTNKLDFNRLFTGIIDSVNDIRDVISYIKNEFKNEIFEDSFNIVGTSYGGMLALTAGYLLDEIKTVVSINSSACWRVLVENRSFETFRLFSMNKPVVDIEQVGKFIDRYDPCFNIDKFNLRPLLLMNGAMDTTFTFELVKPFYDKLDGYYSSHHAMESTSWLRYQKAGHQVVYEMVRDIVIWLNKWNKK